MTQWVQPDNLHFRLIRVRTSTAGNLTRYILKIQVKWGIRWEELNGTYGEKRNAYGFLRENLKEREDMENLGVDELIIINGS